MNRAEKIGEVHSLRYNWFMNFILTASNLLFPLITFPYVSRVLLADGNGKIAFASSISNYFMMVASLGIPTYGIRACAQARDNKEELTKTVEELLIINLITTIVVMVTYLVAVITVPRFRSDETLFYIFGIGVMLNFVGVNWFYQALEKFDYITARSIAFKIASVVLMFLLVNDQDDYVIYGAITVFAAAGSNILNFLRLRKYIQFRRFDSLEFKRHLKPILILFAQSVTVSIYTNLDTVMLGFIKNDRQVGLYNASIKMKHLLLSLVTSVGSVLLPRMSLYVKNGDKKLYEVTALKALNFTCMLALPIASYFMVFAKEVLIFLAGSDYIEAERAMQFITFAVIPNGLTAVMGGQILISVQKEKYVLYSVMVGAVSDTILNVLLIPEYGATGAALATMIAEYLVLAVQMYCIKDLLFSLRHQFRLFWYIITTCCSVALTYFTFKSFMMGHPVLRLVLTFSLFGVVYLIILMLCREEFIIDLYKELRSRIRKL